MVPPFDPKGAGEFTDEPTTSVTGAASALSFELERSTSLDESDLGLEMLDLPESRFFARLDERVRRAELLLALLRSGSLSREVVGRALQSQLAAIRQGASGIGAPSLVELLGVLGAVVGELCGAPAASEGGSLDLLVLDEHEVSRDLVALAAESQGHTVRCAGSFEQFVALFGERRPALVIADAELTNAPLRCLALDLRGLLGDVPLALFTSRDDDEVAQIATQASVAWWLPKSRGVEGLTSRLATWIAENRKGTA